jgi:hypothetical protein
MSVNQFKPDLKLRVRAVGNQQGWYFVIDEDRKPLAADFGPLPAGYPFTDETATLFALANASRCIEQNLPGARVVCVCTVPRRTSFERERIPQTRRAA